MLSTFREFILKGLLVIFLIASLLNVAIVVNAAESTSSLPANDPSASQAPALDYFAHLPLLYHPGNPPLGGEARWQSDLIFEKAQSANMRWLRLSVFQWDDIQPVESAPGDPPVYHWEYVQNAALQAAAARGFTIIATIRFAPAWARKIPEYSCGPVAEAQLDAFAEFVQTAVSIYSAPPYNIKYWEIGNEPDVDPYVASFVPNTDYDYGCWGDNSDDYYGGEYYAKMLERVYPLVKAADPASQVLVGGLLTDCDPTYTYPPPGRDCKSSKFLEGILRYNSNQGYLYFDMLSFHGYASYFRGKIFDENQVTANPWGHRGGLVLGKADFLRQVLSSYSADKPLLHTEGALNCPAYWTNNYSCNPQPGTDYYEAQADYVVWLYVRDWAIDIPGVIWFTVEESGWHNSGLLNPDTTTRPAHAAYRFLSQELAGAHYVGTIGNYPELRTYAFGKTRKRIWVMWAPDQIDHTITLPANVLVVYDKYGNPVIPSAGQITVNSPVYVEMWP
ncbi:MAG: hypothetical protein AB1894_16720 [Chloroflexota bacterium]